MRERHGTCLFDVNALLRWTAALVLVVCGIGHTAPVAAQPAETHGTVTETAGAQVVVQLDSSYAVADTATGQVVAAQERGTTGAPLAEVRVRSVSGSLVIARLTDASNAESVQAGQRVVFSPVERTVKKQGTLALRSTPEGAEVTRVQPSASGTPTTLGTTPTAAILPAGTHRLLFRRDGYVPLERVITVQPDTLATILVRLREQRTVAQKGTLAVRAAPDSAQVRVDGTLVGEGDVQTVVDAGTHGVRVTAGGHRAATDSITVEGGQTRSLAPTLARTTGRLRVTTSPEAATVTVGDSTYGTTPLTLERPSGPATLTIEKDGYESVTRTVTVPNEQERTVDVSLRRPLRIAVGDGEDSVARNVEVRRKDDRVRVTYDLPRNDGPYEVQLQLARRGMDFDDVSDDVVRGDVGDEVSGGPNKTIRWNAFQQHPAGLDGDGNRVRVVAEEGPTTSVPGGTGLVSESSIMLAALSVENAWAFQGRVGYETESVGFYVQWQNGGAYVADVGAELRQIGPDFEMHIADQSAFPVAYDAIFSYRYGRGKSVASRLSATVTSSFHRAAMRQKFFYNWSISDNVHLIPTVEWTTLSFTVIRRTDTVRSEFGNREATSTRSNVSFSGPLYGGLGAFFGTNDFGLYLEASRNFNYGGYVLTAGLRF